MNRFSQLAHPLAIPLAGIIVFIALYVVATFFYAGGSEADRAHSGFDWLNNYWCDLIARNGRNGVVNQARPIALTAMIVLFSSLSLFWFRLPDFFRESRSTRLVIGYTGMTAMLILVFVFTKHHDIVIFTGGSLAAIPFAGTLRELYINRWRFLFLFGCSCLACVLLNFYIYLSGWLVAFLPLLQKITLALLLAWFFCVDYSCLFLPGNDVQLIEDESQFSA